LLEIRDNSSSRIKTLEAEIEEEKKGLEAEGVDITSDVEDSWYLRKLDGGLFVLQNVDYILAWIAMEDDGVCSKRRLFLLASLTHQYQIRSHLLQMLDRKNQSLKDIIITLQEQRDNADEDERVGEDSEDQPPSQREILQGLIVYLDGC